MRFVAAYAALILFAAPATHTAEVQELFAPPVGTVLDYHSKTVGKQGTAEPKTFEVDVRRKVVENDELTAKMTYDIAQSDGHYVRGRVGLITVILTR